MKTRVLFLTQAGVIAALYVVLSLLSNAFGLANYAIQVRISEALTVLPFFTPAAIPGITLGCLISNLVTGCAVPDIIFGTLASFLGAIGTYCLRRNKWLAPIPPISANTIVVPFVLRYAYGIEPLWFSFLTVGIGEIISCGIFGLVLLNLLNRYKHILFSHE